MFDSGMAEALVCPTGNCRHVLQGSYHSLVGHCRHVLQGSKHCLVGHCRHVLQGTKHS